MDLPIDLRTAARVPVRIDARCVLGGSGPPLSGWVEDVSRGGAFLATTSEVQIGAAATLELAGADAQVVPLPVIVVRVAEGARAGLGLRFAPLPPAARRWLADEILRAHGRGRSLSL